jgi:anti-sigma factor RsiW
MSVNRPATPASDHAAHDRTAIAAVASRDPDVTPEENQTAQALIAACTECAALHADLTALATAVPAAATPRRPRDFTLTAADADRLRRRGPRAWLRRIGSARDTITRPLALGLTTLGLAALLVSSAPSVLPFGGGGAASAPAEAPAASAEGAANSAAPLNMSPAASPVDNGGVFTGGDSGDGPAATAAPGGGTAATPSLEANVSDDESGLSTLAVVGGFLTLAGLSLFALRWTSRRLG